MYSIRLNVDINVDISKLVGVWAVICVFLESCSTFLPNFKVIASVQKLLDRGSFLLLAKNETQKTYHNWV